MVVNKFRVGSGCYICDNCGKRTREKGIAP